MPLMQRFRGEGERCAVPAVATVIVSFVDILAAWAAILPVCRIPGVWNLNFFKPAHVRAELKSILQRAPVEIPIR